MAEEKLALCPEKLEELFDKHDFNKDGTIDYKEVRVIFKELDISDEDIDKYTLDLNFVLEADKNNDHKINKEEFFAWMNKKAEDKQKAEAK